jgi:hypothetical protein
VEQIRKHDNNLAKQLVDAMNSTVQNLSEGAVHRGGNKRAKFDIAHGWGYVADDEHPTAAQLRRLLALCWDLTRGKQAPRTTRA